MRFFYFFLKFMFFIVLVTSLGCSRKTTNDMTTLLIEAPKISSKLGAFAGHPTTGYKVCYGVNVTGEGLTQTPLSCGAALGSFQGFKTSGSTFEMEVPKGTNRKVDLYAFISTDTTATCPTWQTSCNAKINCNLYKLASQAGVSMDTEETRVALQVNFPGFANNAVTQESASTLCQAQLRAGLNSAGEIVGSTFSKLSGTSQSQAFASVYESTTSGTFHAVTRSHLATESAILSPTPSLKALSRKPDTGELFGMTADNQVVKVSSTGTFTVLAGAGCPFPTCSLPKWFRSFSIGFNTSVYGLDWAGKIWKVNSSTSVTQTSTAVPPHIQQVVFY